MSDELILGIIIFVAIAFWALMAKVDDIIKKVIERMEK